MNHFYIDKIPFKPDIIWASPPCTYFSVASIGHHWNKNHTPKTKEAVLGVKIVQRTLDIIKELVSRAIDNSVTPPRENIIRVMDDGSTSQLIIELANDLDATEVKHVFTEYDNITDLKIVKRKVPTVITVNGKNGVTATYTHDSAIAAYDRNYLQVNNDELESPAACKDFAQKLFRANLETQYEYGIDTFEGAHLSENDIVRVETEDVAFAGNYRVRGKRIQFDENNMAIGISINRKPPTLAEFISRQDN